MKELVSSYGYDPFSYPSEPIWLSSFVGKYVMLMQGSGGGGRNH